MLARVFTFLQRYVSLLGITQDYFSLSCVMLCCNVLRCEKGCLLRNVGSCFLSAVMYFHLCDWVVLQLCQMLLSREADGCRLLAALEPLIVCFDRHFEVHSLLHCKEALVR